MLHQGAGRARGGLPSLLLGRRFDLWASLPWSFSSMSVESSSRQSGGNSQTIHELWEEYFSGPSQWWDNRNRKGNPRAPDFKHKVTGEALWIDGWYTPEWVKEKFQLVARVGLRPDATCNTKRVERAAQGKRQAKDNDGKLVTACESARALGQIVEGGGNMHVQSVNSLSEALVVLKNRLQRGMIIYSYMYVDVLKRCLEQKDLLAAKQVHDCIIKSGLERNDYVVSNLLRVYIGCGRLEEARHVFDGLVKKGAGSCNKMIAGYLDYNQAEDAMGVFRQMHEEDVQPNAGTYMIILKACASLSALKWGKEVHACIRHGGLKSDVRVGTALLGMYAKCGSIQEARRIFDNLMDHDIISWTVMIGAYAQSGDGKEAYRLILEMEQDGFKPDAITYLSILNACASAGALEWVKKVHRHALDAGHELDVRVGNALVHMYAKSGSIDDARVVFDRMKVRNVVSWTVMIGAYAEHGRGHEAYDLFLQMQGEGCEPDAITYLSILNACASAGALEWVKKVHRHALDAGRELDVRVGNALVHMYAKSGSIDDARVVFDRMKVRNVVSWTVMIGAYAEHGRGHEAFDLFLQMQGEGCEPDAITYLSILNACASAGALEWVKKVHRHALDAGRELDVRVGNALVHMYAKSGSIDDARVVFDRMKVRDVVSWNVMIGAYAEHGRGHEAYDLYLQMQGEGCEPDAITYLSILNACASAGALEWVKKVHRHALDAGRELDVRVGNALVHMYAKSGSIDDARVVFDRMKVRDVVSWNVMIGAYAEHGRGHEAYDLFLQMQGEGCEPDAITYLSILNACASAGALEWVKKVHRHALDAGRELDVRVGNALVHMYAKSGSIDDARVVFDRMKVRDVVSWNSMISGLAQHGLGQDALEVFRQMAAHDVKPDGFTFVAVLSACSHAGLVEEGLSQYLAMTQEYGIEPDVSHCNCMVDLLGRAGRLMEAKHFIDSMAVEPDEATWGALLGSCRTYGNVELGELAAREWLKLDPENAATYVLLSNIYAESGNWDMVSGVRTMMRERGIRKEPGRSWIEVDNKIHDFLVADLSHPECKEINENKDKLIEKLKAEGYIPDTRLVLKNRNMKDKELDICSHSEKLAIVYGLMHTPPGNPIRVFENLRVCTDCHTATKLISKVEGREIIVRDANRFHHFKNGVCSCGDYW
ncbi:hypothetical protein KC19_1G285400 [Ceratodon purpureus]|uniref:DYW domain-containing protein n=1 Tax=Ceratodon purpureus TaxID=3225 RepID=A0A8T0JBJ9_CERPU|nr:hypothetical protein KC19_1G285400 [Ceratodon purpureus]